MLEILSIVLVWNIYYSVETRIKFRELESEVNYGTFSNENMFPEDPRLQIPKSWWEYIFD
jgi:hypothetical protein